MNIFFREIRANAKSLVIWIAIVALLILIGVSKFAAISVWEGSHVISFTIKGAIKEEQLLYSLSAVRHVINMKLRQEHLAGIAVVQSFGQEQRRLQRFDRLNEDHTRAHLETVSAFAVFFPAVEILSTAAVVLLLWQGSAMVAVSPTDRGVALIRMLVMDENKVAELERIRREARCESLK